MAEILKESHAACPTVSPLEAAADRRSLACVLNTFLREAHGGDPRLAPAALAALPARLGQVLRAQGTPLAIELPATRRRLYTAARRFSEGGYHAYADAYWLDAGDGAPVALPDWRAPVAFVLEEIAARHGGTHAAAEALAARVHNSQAHMRRYAAHQTAVAAPADEAAAFITAEQGLVCGHPLHPAPKSSEGFADGELADYAPELGARFRLRYWAVARADVDDAFLPGVDACALLPAAVMAAAQVRLPRQRQDDLLLPLHPWQAQRLVTEPVFAAALADGRLLDLGVLGEPVYPTSSVRTVWDPAHPVSFKLALDVRITNFVRVNPREHVARALDASRVLARVRARLAFAGTRVLLELGYRRLCLAGVDDALNARLTVIFRDSPTLPGKPAPQVVAVLLEPAWPGRPAPLAAVLAAAHRRHPARNDAALARAWIARYLAVVLRPLLWLFLEHGVSLEAHVQNSLVVLEDGWPVSLCLRDLEGVSVSRARGAALGAQAGVGADSPLWYDDAEAWQRFKYYVFVNHLGHLIDTLAGQLEIPAEILWDGVADALQRDDMFTGSRRAYRDDVLASDSWPAKANLLSNFLGRGETPLYLPIDNPLRR